jgi:AcrR family transcriptional regulator
MARRKSVTKVALTKELIVKSAYNLLRKGTLDDIKTTAIGKALGVTQPALYNHYKGRAELVADVVDIVCKDIVAKMVDVRGSWEECTRKFVDISAERFELHRGVANYLQTLGPYEPAARELVDHWMSMFLRNGFTEIDAVMATFHVNQYLLGHFSWYQTSINVGPNRKEKNPLSLLQPSDYLNAPNALRFDRLKRTVSEDQRLRDGIDLIIMGLAQRRARRVT